MKFKYVIMYLYKGKHHFVFLVPLQTLCFSASKNRE